MFCIICCNACLLYDGLKVLDLIGYLDALDLKFLFCQGVVKETFFLGLWRLGALDALLCFSDEVIVVFACEVFVEVGFCTCLSVGLGGTL